MFTRNGFVATLNENFECKTGKASSSVGVTIAHSESVFDGYRSPDRQGFKKNEHLDYKNFFVNGEI